VGGFDPALRGGEDRDFVIKAVAAGARFVPDDARGTLRVYYRRHAASVSAAAPLMYRNWRVLQQRVVR
jgi:hypothetical protein